MLTCRIIFMKPSLLSLEDDVESAPQVLRAQDAHLSGATYRIFMPPVMTSFLTHADLLASCVLSRLAALTPFATRAST